MERAHPHHRAELGDRAPQGLTLRVFKGQGGAGTRGQGLAGVTHSGFPSGGGNPYSSMKWVNSYMEATNFEKCKV